MIFCRQTDGRLLGGQRVVFFDIVHPGEPAPLDRALAYAQRAVELRPQSARSQEALMVVWFARGETALAFAAAEKAMTLNPYDTNVVADYGARLMASGQIERGVAMLEQAVAYTVVRPAWFDSYLFLGTYLAGDLAAAAEHASMVQNDDLPLGFIARAVAANMSGDRDKARRAIEGLVALNSLWLVDPRRQIGKFFPSADIQDRLLHDLEAAGLGATSSRG